MISLHPSFGRFLRVSGQVVLTIHTAEVFPHYTCSSKFQERYCEGWKARMRRDVLQCGVEISRACQTLVFGSRTAETGLPLPHNAGSRDIYADHNVTNGRKPQTINTKPLSTRYMTPSCSSKYYSG